MKKVLIYMNKNQLRSTGGPTGYNYNLQLGLQNLSNNSIQIDYIDLVDSVENINSRVNSITNERLKNVLTIAKSVWAKGKRMYGRKHYSLVELSNYDAVHFHSTRDLYDAKTSLEKYPGKVILSSHSPTMPYKEVYELLSDFEKKHMKWFYKKLPEIDQYAFKRADYIIFPCEEAQEPYFHDWPGYEALYKEYLKKYRYLLTGTLPKKYSVSAKDFREKHGIPEDAFVISYVGRHNQLKGYDRLKEIGSDILNEYENVYIVVAGKEEPLRRLDNDRWIETGWTDDPGSVMNSADMFLLPNKETYFDLVMLEILSLGQIVVASKTGGNKYFSKYNDTGIFLYEDNRDAVRIIEKLMLTAQEDRQKMRTANKKLFESEFTNEKFAEGYQKLLAEILL